MKAGYVRGVFSSSQVQRILQAFDAASCGEVVINVRPENNHLFTRLLEKLAPGDTLAVWTLDCAGPSLNDVTELVAVLNNKKISFESVAEGLVIPGGAELSPAMIAARIDRYRSTDERPAPRAVGRRPASVPATKPEAAVLVAAPARKKSGRSKTGRWLNHLRCFVNSGRGSPRPEVVYAHRSVPLASHWLG